MTIESALVKPIADAIVAGLKKINGIKVKKNAASELSKVIQDLLQVNPDLTAAEVKILSIKAAGIFSKELIVAEKILTTIKTKSRVATSKKATAQSGYAPVRKAAKKSAPKKSGAVAHRKPSVPKTTKSSKHSTTVPAKPTKRK